MLACSINTVHRIVGEPSFPVAAAERSSRVVVNTFLVGDHNFTKFSLVPSVCLILTVSEKVSDSGYNGKVFVGLKI